jgi:hypothetical protein
MKKLIRGLSATLFAALAAGLVIAAELPGRDDYAFGFALTARGDAEFFALDIPLEVYRSVADPELRDAGVYNADGQPVPRLFERPPKEDKAGDETVPLGLVPLYGEQVDQPEKLRLLLHRDESGTTLDLDAGAGEAPADGAPLTAYIADARDLEHPLKALTFKWPDSPTGFIGTVRVEDSDDLQHWRQLGSANLAALEHETTRIRRQRIRLSKTASGEKVSDFLRITWQDMPDSWRLDSVVGVYPGQGTPARRQWLELDPLPAERDSDHVYDVGGFPPVDRVSLLLPGDTIVVRASVFYRLDEKEQWRFAYNGVFHSISRKGNTVRSPPAAIPEVRARQWKIRLDTGVTQGPVRLRLGWRPDRLLFVAQGPQPFELATGRARDVLDSFPQEKMLGDSAIFGMLRKTGDAGAARLGKRREIAGPAGLQAPPASKLRVLLLWAGLIGAIAVVGWLVFSLMREMR